MNNLPVTFGVSIKEEKPKEHPEFFYNSPMLVTLALNGESSQPRRRIQLNEALINLLGAEDTVSFARGTENTFITVYPNDEQLTIRGGKVTDKESYNFLNSLGNFSDDSNNYFSINTEPVVHKFAEDNVLVLYSIEPFEDAPKAEDIFEVAPVPQDTEEMPI